MIFLILFRNVEEMRFSKAVQRTFLFHLIFIWHQSILSAGGKPPTMVTAGKTCKAGHLEKESIRAEFVLMKFHYSSVVASNLFSRKCYFSSSDLFRKNLKKQKVLFNCSIAMTSWSSETPFRLGIGSHMWSKRLFMLQNLRKKARAMQHQDHATCGT